MNDTGEDIFLSSARVLGEPSTVVNSGVLFPRKNSFLEGLSGARPTVPQQISVSVSSYADFFSECYAHYLKQSSVENFVPIEVFSEAVIQRRPSWNRFLTTIRTTFPDSEIKIWKLDATETDYRNAIDLLFGKKWGDRFSYSSTSKRGGFEPMSQNAFDRFRVLGRKDGIDVALSQLGAQSDEFPCSNTIDRMNIFTDEQASTLSQRYEADLAALDLFK